MENLVFHSLLRWKMIYDTNSHYLTYTFLFRKDRRVTFLTWEWKGKSAWFLPRTLRHQTLSNFNIPVSRQIQLNCHATWPFLAKQLIVQVTPLSSWWPEVPHCLLFLCCVCCECHHREETAEKQTFTATHTAQWACKTTDWHMPHDTIQNMKTSWINPGFWGCPHLGPLG